MSRILDDLASVHGQGSEEAKANASARAAHHGLDLIYQSNLDLGSRWVSIGSHLEPRGSLLQTAPF